MYSRDASRGRISSELHLTRNLLLEQTGAPNARPGDALRPPRGLCCVTHWEELLCAAINTKLDRLMAVISIRQPDGYSSVVNNHHSTEYVRFFIDWGRGGAYEPVSLLSFEVKDAPWGQTPSPLPYQQLVTSRFDADRYWDCVLDGLQPKIRAVLSWNREPPLEAGHQPMFGNVIESRIRTESIRDVLSLYEQPAT